MNTSTEQRNNPRNYSFSELRKICQHTSSNPAQEGFTGKVVRFFSIYITFAFLHTSISPNAITILSVFVFFSGMGTFFFGEHSLNILGGLLLIFSVLLDASDGEVARFRKTAGRLGANYVEPVSHDIQYGISFIMLGAALALTSGDQLFFLLGGVASVATLLFRLFESRFWQYYHAGITKNDVEEIKQGYSSLPFYARLASWFRRRWYSSTGFALLTFLAACADKLEYILWFWAVGMCLFTAMLALKQFGRLYRESKAIE